MLLAKQSSSSKDGLNDHFGGSTSVRVKFGRGTAGAAERSNSVGHGGRWRTSSLREFWLHVRRYIMHGSGKAVLVYRRRKGLSSVLEYGPSCRFTPQSTLLEAWALAHFPIRDQYGIITAHLYLYFERVPLQLALHLVHHDALLLG